MSNHLALQVTVVVMETTHVLANVGEWFEALHQALPHAHHVGGHFGGIAGNVVMRIARHFFKIS
jgi:hypothetical protein